MRWENPFRPLVQGHGVQWHDDEIAVAGCIMSLVDAVRDAIAAVGLPASMLRFSALQCYDNVRAPRLPPELADRNPTGTMWRLVDGEWSQRNV